MSSRLLNLQQSRFLRWLILIVGSVTISSLIVSFAVAAVVPDETYRRLPQAALFWATIALAVTICAAVITYTRARR
ncbi:hypothetical protein ACFVTY_34010 [Streptomyces sp. NPDC058067]|uniref:hypothetical protein n=1 Tax=Streptomyces sp. NPDC058067 TaxID=3346324 RepID=UPI0036EE8549